MGTAEVERFVREFVAEHADECWLWSGSVDKDGYGLFNDDVKLRRAHRFSFEAFGGELNGDLTIDHLCGEKSCVNPAHMEQVSRSENSRRGNPRPVTCKRGHVFDDATTYNKTNGRRTCRSCHNEWKVAWRAKTGKH